MSLKILSTHELIKSTRSALQISRDAEVIVLRHFQEIEDRRLWVGVGSLYGYLSETFRLTGDQIYPRLQAMRLMKILIQKAKHQPIPKPRKQLATMARSRHIPAEVKREMEKTRHLGCGHVNPETGRQCGTKHFLQMDHVHEYALGGVHETHNLQWRCGFHNRLRFQTRSGAPSLGAEIYLGEAGDRNGSV